MSADEPLAPEPARGPSRAVSTGVLAFLGGAALTAAIAWLHPWQQPAAVQPLAQPSPAPAPPPGTDLATLAAREQMLAGRLDAIEARLRDADAGARVAASYATQAERLMIAVAVRRAVERGQPLGLLEGHLRRRFGQDHGDAVGTIVQAGGQSVTLEDLRVSLEAIAPRLGTASGQGVWAAARSMIGDLVVLRRADTPSPRAADRLARARRLLAEGQVEAALAEVTHMPGAANAESWAAAARRVIATRAALREIENAAIETPAPAGT